ncbi:hypothetical protein EDC01DRAFT_120447 [Geopyxis carbonaria]|nr:hypothetical protein EDC01DRAFT_120447 [Geopyxis carbonaria]
MLQPPPTQQHTLYTPLHRSTSHAHLPPSLCSTLPPTLRYLPIPSVLPRCHGAPVPRPWRDWRAAAHLHAGRPASRTRRPGCLAALALTSSASRLIRRPLRRCETGTHHPGTKAPGATHGLDSRLVLCMFVLLRSGKARVVGLGGRTGKGREGYSHTQESASATAPAPARRHVHVGTVVLVTPGGCGIVIIMYRTCCPPPCLLLVVIVIVVAVVVVGIVDVDVVDVVVGVGLTETLHAVATTVERETTTEAGESSGVKGHSYESSRTGGKRDA